MPAPTERQIINQRKRAVYAHESLARTTGLIEQAKACPCPRCVSAATVAAEGTRSAITDARLWEGRLYGHERRYAYTLMLSRLDRLEQTIPFL